MNRAFSIRLTAAALMAGALIQPGCRSVPVAPPLPPPAISRPAFEKTFGEAMLDKNGLSLRFKDMRLLVDPTPALLAADGATADFVLFTRAAAIAGPFRAGQKAIGPRDGAAAAKAAGIGAFKALSGGQRLMLSKGAAFAFASAVTGRAMDGSVANGYLFEFDNGRNLLVLPPVADLAPVREFVYTLRDDAKSVYAGFFPVTDAAAGAEAAALIQPQFAVFTGAPGMDRPKLNEALGAQMFSGEAYVAPERDTVPF